MVRCVAVGSAQLCPISWPNSQWGKWICADPFLARSASSLFVCYFATGQRKLQLSFRNAAGRFLYVPPTGANRILVKNKKTSDLGMFHTALALEEELFHFAYFVSTMELARIMDFYKGLWSNWQLSGLKGCFWVAVKGFRCETLVFKSTEQNVWLLSAPPLSFQRKGETPGEARTLKSNLLFSIWMPGAFFPPNPSAAGEGGRLRWHKQRLAQWWIKREAGKMRPRRMDAWMKGSRLDC